MTYQNLAKETRRVFTNYNRQRSCCLFGLPDSDKTEYLLMAMMAIDNDNTPYPDSINETILLVGLTAFKHYLEEKKNNNLSERIDAVIENYASASLTAEMQVCIDQAKNCIRNHGETILLGTELRYLDGGSALIPAGSKEKGKWPKNVAAIILQNSVPDSSANASMTI